MASQNKFIRPAGKTTSIQQPAQQQRPMLEEVQETRAFEFPNRGQAPESAAPVATPQPTQAPYVKTYAEIDPAYTSIDLPSGFQFYSFDSLAARTLLGGHQAKFSRAAKEKRLRYSVEALSATLEPNRSAFDLTPGDFFFLMYWQRVNSFSKSPMIITAYCENEDHLHSVYEGDEEDDPDNPGEKRLVKKPEDSLRIEQVLHNTTLDSKYAETVDLSGFTLTQRYNLGVETMRDVVEATEILQDAEEVTEDQLFLMKYAPFLKTGPGQANLKEKMGVIEQMSADDLTELEEYMGRVTQYGVSETANLTCKECGASVRVHIPIDALTFLPGRR